MSVELVRRDADVVELLGDRERDAVAVVERAPAGRAAPPARCAAARPRAAQRSRLERSAAAPPAPARRARRAAKPNWSAAIRAVGLAISGSSGPAGNGRRAMNSESAGSCRPRRARPCGTSTWRLEREPDPALELGPARLERQCAPRAARGAAARSGTPRSGARDRDAARQEEQQPEHHPVATLKRIGDLEDPQLGAPRARDWPATSLGVGHDRLPRLEPAQRPAAAGADRLPGGQTQALRPLPEGVLHHPILARMIADDRQPPAGHQGVAERGQRARRARQLVVHRDPDRLEQPGEIRRARARAQHRADRVDQVVAGRERLARPGAARLPAPAAGARRSSPYSAKIRSQLARSASIEQVGGGRVRRRPSACPAARRAGK